MVMVAACSAGPNTSSVTQSAATLEQDAVLRGLLIKARWLNSNGQALEPELRVANVLEEALVQELEPLLTAQGMKITQRFPLTGFLVAGPTAQDNLSESSFIMWRNKAQTVLSTINTKQITLGRAKLNDAGLNAAELPVRLEVTLQSSAYEEWPIDVRHSEMTNTPSEVTDEPNDALYQQGYQWALKAIMAQEAWNDPNGLRYVWPPAGQSAVRVAVLDTGCELAGATAHELHSDFQPITTPALESPIRTDLNYDVMFNPPRAGAPDGHGHGTHVTGVISAQTNNQGGMAGVSWRAEVVCIKMVSDAGRLSYVSMAEGIRYAREIGVNIINASWGSRYSYPELESAVRAFVADGGLLVVSRGNAGGAQPLYYPASYSAETWLQMNTSETEASMDAKGEGWRKGIVAVGAVTRTTQGAYPLADFSSYFGTTVVAPGEDILSTWNTGAFEVLDGTSMAAPHVVGVAAMAWTKAQELAVDPAQPAPSNFSVRAALKRSADDYCACTPSSGATRTACIQQYGSGLVNLARAVNVAVAPRQLDPSVCDSNIATSTPTPSPTSTPFPTATPGLPIRPTPMPTGTPQPSSQFMIYLPIVIR